MVSAAPPAANGTTTRTGLPGHSAANAPVDDRTLAAAKTTAMGFMLDTRALFRPSPEEGAQSAFTRVFDALRRPSRRMGAAPCFETPRHGASDTRSPALEARLLSMRPIEICVISSPAYRECPTSLARPPRSSAT